MRIHISLILFLLMACGVDNQQAELKAVRDQYRMLGIIQTEDGMYEFRLCSASLTSFNAKSIKDNCINPLIDSEGNYRRFASLPSAESTLVLKIRDASVAVLIGAGAGLALYVGARFLKHGEIAKKIVGETRLLTVNKRLNDAVRINDYTFLKAIDRKAPESIPLFQNTFDIKSIEAAYSEGGQLLNAKTRAYLIKNIDHSFINVKTDAELANTFQIWQKRNADLLSLATKDSDELVVNKGLEKFLLDSAHGFKSTDKVYLKQLAVLDEALDGRVYSYTHDGKRYAVNKFGEPEVITTDATVDDSVFMTMKELTDDVGDSSNSVNLSEIKDRINLQRERQRQRLKQGVKQVKKSIVSDPNDIATSRLVDKIKGRFKNIFKATDATNKAQAYDVSSVAKEIAGSYDGSKTARIYVPAKAQAIAGNTTAVASAASFFFIPSLKRMLPNHASLEATKNWSALVSDFGSGEESKVKDLRIILKGLAQATDSHISTQVRIFGL